MFTVISRKDAAAAGSSKYYTGKPCSKGHDSQRYTSTGNCCKCNILNVKAYNNKMRFAANNAAAGNFVYPLHPDDHATAEAYCQALDMQRGISPSKRLERQQAPHPHDAPADAIQRTRSALLDTSKWSATTGPYMPKP